MKNTVVYDMNGTLTPKITQEGLAAYRATLEKAMEPLERLSDESVKAALAQHGVQIKGRNLASTVKQTILQWIENPPRHSPARTVYNDWLEIMMERGQLPTRAFSDALKKGNRLDRERKIGLHLVALSRGTDSLLAKTLRMSGLEGRIAAIYSTLAFGGDKNLRTYQGVYRMLLEQGLKPVRFYEDEPSNIEALFQLGFELSGAEFPFQIIWVNRNHEKDDGVKHLERQFQERKYKHQFADVFQRIPDLA